jgi:hypothetical protein
MIYLHIIHSRKTLSTDYPLKEKKTIFDHGPEDQGHGPKPTFHSLKPSWDNGPGTTFYGP